MNRKIEGQSVLVLGGVRSGKSAYAEKLLMQCPPPWTYIATAQHCDDADMQARIRQHQQRRGAGWRTIEEAVIIGSVLSELGPGPVMVDCLTLWLTNLLLMGHDIQAQTGSLVAALAARKQMTTVLVSGEVGLGTIPDNALARRFVDESGTLHQALARQVDQVTMVIAGLPVEVK